MWHGGGRPWTGHPGGLNDPTQIDTWIFELATNRRSKFLPDTLAEKYTQAVNDPELMNQREDLALIEIRFSQLMSKIETSDPKEKWIEFANTIESAKRALADGDVARGAALIILLEKRIGDKLSDYLVWKEIAELMESRRRVIESEGNRLVRMQQMLNAEDAMRLIDTLLGAVKRHTKDPHTYAAIAYEFAVATGAAHNGRLERGTEEVQSGGPGELDQGKLLGSGTQGSDITG
jgi:hypothetical protein